MSVKKEVLILLLIFYAVFVLGDAFTTFWLIRYYPGGISGEMNPLAYLIFTRYGYLGMLVSKMIFFIIFSIIFIALYSRYYNISWFRESMEIIILGLSGLSMLVVLNNIFSIIAISYFIYYTQPIWLLKILIFLLTLMISGLGAGIMFKDVVRSTETLIGSTLAMIPLFIWPTLEPTLYLTYLISLFIAISTSTYLLENAGKSICNKRK